MDFAFSEEQLEFRRSVERFVRERTPLASARELHEHGTDHDIAVWRTMGESLGLHGLHIAEDRGGQGFRFLDLALVAGELGRELVCSPYFASSVVAATLLSALPRCESVDELLARVATGTCLATLVRPGFDVAVHGDTSGPGPVVLDGTAHGVPFGQVAEVLLVLARDSRGEPLLVAVPRSPDVVTESSAALDLCDRVARCRFDGASGAVLAMGPPLLAAIEATDAAAAVYLSCEMVGGADACLQAAVSYARERMQFGRPIGSFQAIKHLCATMFAEVELARGAAHYAAWCVSTGDATTTRHASLAKAMASDMYLFVADAALHVHGGIGFTWEHDSHLHLRRARSRSLQFGDARAHRERFLATSGFARSV